MSYSKFENIAVYYRGFCDPVLAYIFNNAVDISFKEYDLFTVQDAKGNIVKFKYEIVKEG